MSGDLAPFHAGCAAGELRVQACEGCGRRQFPPRAVCLACRSTDLRWEAIAPHGTIATFTIVHRAPHAALRERIPYAIALVDCEPGVRLMTNVFGDVSRLAIGAAVAFSFEAPVAGGAPLPVARLA